MNQGVIMLPRSITVLGQKFKVTTKLPSKMAKADVSNEIPRSIDGFFMADERII